jgi:transposase
VPRVLVWDGEGAVGQRRRRVTVLTEAAHAFRGVLGARILICDPGDPEAKGLVEQADGYLETSFLPGRPFASPADFNAQLDDWLVLANRRQRRALGCAPADRIDADRAAMLRLPPVAPAIGWRSWLRLPRDYYVRLDGNDYSVRNLGLGRPGRRCGWTGAHEPPCRVVSGRIGRPTPRPIHRPPSGRSAEARAALVLAALADEFIAEPVEVA